MVLKVRTLQHLWVEVVNTSNFSLIDHPLEQILEWHPSKYFYLRNQTLAKFTFLAMWHMCTSQLKKNQTLVKGTKMFIGELWWKNQRILLLRSKNMYITHQQWCKGLWKAFLVCLCYSYQTTTCNIGACH
jgi:hypothetical protein